MGYNKKQKQIARKIWRLKSYDKIQQNKENPSIHKHELRGMKINALEVRLKCVNIKYTTWNNLHMR